MHDTAYVYRSEDTGFSVRFSGWAGRVFTHWALLPALKYRFCCAVPGYLLSNHCCPAASHHPSRLYQTLLEILINRPPHEMSLYFSLYLMYFPLPQDFLLKTVGFHSLREINCGFLTTPVLLSIVAELTPIPLGNSPWESPSSILPVIF